MRLEIVAEAPRENTTPIKIEIPLKAADSERGMYGHVTLSAKATIKTRRSL